MRHTIKEDINRDAENEIIRENSFAFSVFVAIMNNTTGKCRFAIKIVKT